MTAMEKKEPSKSLVKRNETAVVEKKEPIKNPAVRKIRIKTIDDVLANDVKSKFAVFEYRDAGKIFQLTKIAKVGFLFIDTDKGTFAINGERDSYSAGNGKDPNVFVGIINAVKGRPFPKAFTADYVGSTIVSIRPDSVYADQALNEIASKIGCGGKA
jgi:hypothetical protein